MSGCTADWYKRLGIEVGNGMRTLESAQVVLMEMNLPGLHEGLPLFHESDGYMGKHGFQVYDRPYDGALSQADAIFVRSSSTLIFSARWS